MKSHNVKCKSFQEKLLMADSPNRLLEDDSTLKTHIKKCSECSSLMKSILLMHRRMQQAPEIDLKPNRRSLVNARKLMSVRQEFQMPSNYSIWQSLRQIIEYKIPVYQAVSGLVVMLMLVFVLSGTIMPPEAPWSDGDRLGKIERSGSSDLYAVDSLDFLKPDRGQNAREDSVLIGFLVPTL